MNVIPGHFTTSHFHLSHYLDLFDLKSNAAIARNVAVELAVPYIHSTPVDTIVCMEGTEIIGAYLAEELRQSGRSVINSEREIHVVSPIYSVDKKLIFHSNVQEKIKNKNVLLLVSSISSGATIKSALECLSYYAESLWEKALVQCLPLFKKEISLLKKDIPTIKCTDGRMPSLPATAPLTPHNQRRLYENESKQKGMSVILLSHCYFMGIDPSKVTLTVLSLNFYNISRIYGYIQRSRLQLQSALFSI